MTSLYNRISNCFVVLKHEIFVTYPTNYDAIILQQLLLGDRGARNARCKSIWELFIVEVDSTRIKTKLTIPKKITDSFPHFNISTATAIVFSPYNCTVFTLCKYLSTWFRIRVRDNVIVIFLFI